MIKYIFISTSIAIFIFIVWGLFIGFPCDLARNSGNLLLSSIIWLPIVSTIGLLGLIKPSLFISQIFFIFAFMGGVFWVLNICFFFLSILFNFGNINYSSNIKKVAIPMQIELEGFYTKNKRFPTTIERNEMLEKVGCVMDKGVCVFDGDRIRVRVKITKYSYIFRSSLGNTGCFSAIGNDGHYTKASCATSSCIKFGQ